MFQTNKFTAYITFHPLTTQYFSTHTNMVEIQAQEIHAVHLITICRISHFAVFGKSPLHRSGAHSWCQGGDQALLRLSPWAPGPLAKTHKTAKMSTPEQLRD